MAIGISKVFFRPLSFVGIQLLCLLTDAFVCLYNLTGYPPKASEISVVIRIDDINDNAPVFVQPKNLGVEENAPNGSYAGNITATDSDLGDNQRVYYYIVNGTGYGLFVINNVTGQLTTTAVFDYETKSSYTLVVKAEDQGRPQRSTLLSTVVNIRSVDEYQPQFSNESYTFLTPGSSKKGDIVGRVRAFDRDDGPDGIVRYELVFPVRPFAVNVSTGYIFLTEDFLAFKLNSRRKRDAAEEQEDTESDSFELVIKASSGRPGSMSDTVTATMDIDYSCIGCRPTPVPVRVDGPMSSTILIIIIVLSIVGFFCICFFMVCLLVARRKKERKNKQKGSAEAIGLQPVNDNPYGGKGLTNHYKHVPSDSHSNSQVFIYLFIYLFIINVPYR